MDFDGAIKAHAAWKMKLTQYLQKPDGSLQPDAVAFDDRCELGKWIHGEAAAKHWNDPDYQTLRQAHAAFHEAAADVVRKAGAKQSVAEDTALGADSPYDRASKAVTIALLRMRDKRA